MKKFLLLLLVINIFITVSAQDQFSSKSDEFIEQIQKMMRSSKNEKLIEIGDEFGLTYGDLTTGQKEQIHSLSNLLKSKKQKIAIFGYYYGGIVAAANSADVTSEHLTQFLTVCTKTFEKDGASKFGAYIKSASKFMIDLRFYKSKYYSYRLDGGTFSFDYVEEAVEETIVDKFSEQKEEEEVDPFEAMEDDEESDDWAIDDDESWGDEEEEEIEIIAADKEETGSVNFGYKPPAQPTVSGPVVKIENADIVIDAPGDSGIVIEKTSGQYMLFENQFVGSGGKFDWSNSGENIIEAHANLGGYNFKTNGKVLIQSEGATLHYPEATDVDFEGAFEYRSTKKSPNYPAKYPRFISYKSQIELKNIGENIKYFGGLSLQGSIQSSSSVYGDVSTIIVSYDGVEKFRARARKFDITENIISSDRAYLLALVNDDSIINYNMSFSYNKEETTLSFFKGPNTGTIGPFFDTQHNVEINAEKLSWNLSEDNLDFSMVYASNMKSATVESIDFYTDNRFSRMQGLSKFHPLTVLMYYSNKKRTREVYVSDLAKFSKQRENVLRSAMSKLSREGYVSYSPGNGKIIVKRKAVLYSKARKKKADWDQLLIFSRARNKNITYDLENDDLIIRGVGQLTLSVAQQVEAIPDSGLIILRGNRDLFFDGKIFSGQFQFTGTDYRFDYDSFFVDMSKIDSIRLQLEELDSLGNEGNVHTLGNKLVYSSGVLYIDKKDNKSHKKNYHEYPIFDATTGAYVFFDKDEILNNAYDTTVYFRIPPFVVDSLNESSPDKVSFYGTFYGGNIIEPFDEILKVMPDFSFGFQHDIPEKGHEIYGGKGKLFNKLKLNKKGLRSNGEITYLTTTLKSPDFILYLDSATTDTGTVATMEEGELDGVLFPVAKVNDYSLNWQIANDEMHISNNDSVITMYNGKALLDGTITATPTGAIGSGKALSGRAVSESHEMYFSQDFFKARHANFYVNTEDETDTIPTIKADSVFLDYNMVEQYASFGPEEEGAASIEFPFMKYKTSISNGTWDMVENTVTMVKDKEEDIEYSYFYSTHEDQDSLVFNADSAVCDLDESTLKVYGVPFIKVADSKIVPDSNKVFIKENADIQSLVNATVYIDTLNEYHTLDSGAIDILSRHKYTGNALYQYVNALEDTFHIVFKEFRVLRYSEKKRDRRVYTMSSGYVFEEDSFFIAPRIQFYGDVELDARENFLFFNGFVKIDLKGGFLSDWFKLEARINPADVKIDLKDPKSSDGTPLITGLHIADGDSVHLYSSFIALKEMATDFDIMTTSGVFGYNPFQNEFSISNEGKANGESLAGNVIVLNDSTSEIRYEGSFEFINNIPKIFEIHAGGNGEGRILSGEYNFHTLMTTYFKLPSVLTQQMSEVVYEASRGSYEADPGSTELTYRIAEIAGNNPAQLYSENSMDYTPLFNVSSNFNRTLVFSDISFDWSNEHSAFYSPDSVGLSNIMKNDINALIDGFVEIRKTYQGDEVNIYLQPDSSNWFYISYFNNTVYLLSSDITFNALAFEKSKLDKRTSPTDYAFGLGDYASMNNFIYHYKKDYQGIKADSVNPEESTRLQAELISSIQDLIGGGITKEMDEEFEEEEDIFFDEDLDNDLGDDEEKSDQEGDLEEGVNDDLDSEGINSDDSIENEESFEDDMDDLMLDKDESTEQSTGKKKKKEKKKEKPVEEGSEEESMFEEEDEDEELDNLFEEEESEPVKEEKTKKKKEKKEKPVVEEDEFLEEEPEEIIEEELELDAEDPWADANKKIDKKKNKKEKKSKEKKEPEEESLDSLDDELDDLD